MEKFNLEPNETILKKGALKSYKTEKDILNPFTGDTITGILTPKRFVALWRVKIGYPAGPLVWLVQWLFKRKNIAFSLPLHTLSKIIDGPGFTLTAADGSAHSMSVDAAFSTDAKNKEWVQALTEAVSAACPGKRTHRGEKTVEFENA